MMRFQQENVAVPGISAGTGRQPAEYGDVVDAKDVFLAHAHLTRLEHQHGDFTGIHVRAIEGELLGRPYERNVGFDVIESAGVITEMLSGGKNDCVITCHKILLYVIQWDALTMRCIYRCIRLGDSRYANYGLLKGGAAAIRKKSLFLCCHPSLFLFDLDRFYFLLPIQLTLRRALDGFISLWTVSFLITRPIREQSCASPALAHYGQRHTFLVLFLCC
jgi:hypothetical protein